MDSLPNYTSTIKAMPYLYLEMKKAAGLKLHGFGDLQIQEQALSNNIFQVNTESRKKEIAAAVIKRLKVLDDYLVKKMVNGSIETSCN